MEFFFAFLKDCLQGELASGFQVFSIYLVYLCIYLFMFYLFI